MPGVGSISDAGKLADARVVVHEPRDARGGLLIFVSERDELRSR